MGEVESLKGHATFQFFAKRPAFINEENDLSADHFSAVAGQYAASRPTYPDELFDWLAGIAPRRELAWDCGAGSGQATVPLAARFRRVIATDLSAAQLAGAPALPNVEYRAAPAEASGLPDRCADLVTIAQAMHWYDPAKFHAEVRRVVRAGGIIAAWGYNRLHIAQARVQGIVDEFYEHTIGGYWPPEREHVENGYRDLPFPYAPIEAPPFILRKEWTRAQLLGYLRSWSAVARFKAANAHDPVDALDGMLAAHWPDGKAMVVEWPLFMHVGRVA